MGAASRLAIRAAMCPPIAHRDLKGTSPDCGPGAGCRCARFLVVASGVVESSDAFPLAIIGNRVRLREVGPDDAAAAMAWGADPEFFRFMAYTPVPDLEAEEQFLRGIQAQARARPRLQYHVGVVWLASDELIGMVRLGITSAQHREGDLGYGLRLDRTG